MNRTPAVATNAGQMCLSKKTFAPPIVAHRLPRTWIIAVAAVVSATVVVVPAVHFATRSSPDKHSNADREPVDAQAALVPFDIQGLRIGDRLTEEFASHHCPAKDKGKPNITGSDLIDINGKSVFVFFQFDDFKLIGVSLTFDADAFDSMIDAYTQKFGVAPHDVQTKTVTTRIGGSYTNVTARWNTTSGPFIVSKYGSSVDKGFASLENPEYQTYLQRKLSRDTDALRSKL